MSPQLKRGWMNYLNPLKNDLFSKVDLNMCQNVKPRDCAGVMFWSVWVVLADVSALEAGG